ncbi:hypothetical protein D3C72_1454690 [compost metagenome]
MHLEVGLALLDATGRQQNQAFHPLRQAQGQAQGNRAAEGVTEQGAAVDVQGVEHGSDVVDEEIQVVLHILGLVRAAKAGQVEDNVAVAGFNELRVVALEITKAAGAWTAAMQPEHHRAAAFIQIVQAQAAGGGQVVAGG